MNYWLMKSEPDVFSYDDLVAKGKAEWDGVRNHAAQLNMKAMRRGDLALFYRIGRMLADSTSWPNWNEGDEFKGTRDEDCAAEGAGCAA